MSKEIFFEEEKIPQEKKLPRELQGKNLEIYYRSGEIISQHLSMQHMLEEVTTRYGVESDKIKRFLALAFPVGADPSIYEYTLKEMNITEPSSSDPQGIQEAVYVAIESNADTIFARRGREKLKMHPWIMLLPNNEEISKDNFEIKIATSYIVATWYDSMDIEPAPSSQEYFLADINH